MLKPVVIAGLLLVMLLPTHLKLSHGSSGILSVSLDAYSTSPTDSLVQVSAADGRSFRVGAIVNATGSTPVTGVYGWQFTIGYDPLDFVPQGDPNPLATEGNSLGLYPDGAVNTVLFGSQTARGAVNWAALISANKAVGSSAVNSTAGTITVFFTILGQNPAVNILGSTLLANVSFELLNKTSIPQNFTVSNVIFVGSNNEQISGVVAGVGAAETATNNPPHATFTFSPANDTGPDAFIFNANGSFDTDGTIADPGGFFWDFGDGTQDLGMTGPILIHNYTMIGPFNVSLRVQDSQGATGASRDSLGNVVVNVQPSHIVSDPSGDNRSSTFEKATSNGCISLSQARAVVASSSDFRKMDSSGSYIYANYGVAREGGFCRMVVFFNSAGGDGIEGVVNTDGSIQKIAKVSSANSSAPLMGTSIYGSPSGVNWSGYEVLCTSQCNANGQPTVEGAKMSFRIPTVYAPSASQANINSCCFMSEWVGVGDHEHGHGVLIQAGISKGTDNFANENNVAWYEVNYFTTFPNGTQFGISLAANDHIYWPCLGGPSDGDTMTVLVNETYISYTYNRTFVHFQWVDSNNGSLKCVFDDYVQVPGEYPLSWAFYIVEAPSKEQCVLIYGVPPNQASTNVCQLPAWEYPISESGWLITSCCGTRQIDNLYDPIIYQDILSQCSTGDVNNVAASGLTGNTWSSAWLTSVQDGRRPSQCFQSFTFAPEPIPVVVNSGSSEAIQMAVNGVAGYSSGDLSFVGSSSPSGVSVACPTSSIDGSRPEFPLYTPCTFSSSTPGVYDVTITGTTTLPQGSPIVYSITIRVIVATYTMRDSFSDSVDGITVFVAGGSTSSNGLLVGWIGISAQKNGVSLYGKWLAIAMQPGQFMVEIPTSPYWLSLECWLGATGGIACELTRTLDINQDGVAVNIVELSLIAACFGRSAPCGSDPRQFPGLCPGCATSRDLMGPNGQPDGVINIFDLTIAAQFFGKFDISQGRLFPP